MFRTVTTLIDKAAQLRKADPSLSEFESCAAPAGRQRRKCGSARCVAPAGVDGSLTSAVDPSSFPIVRASVMAKRVCVLHWRVVADMGGPTISQCVRVLVEPAPGAGLGSSARPAHFLPKRSGWSVMSLRARAVGPCMPTAHKLCSRLAAFVGSPSQPRLSATGRPVRWGAGRPEDFTQACAPGTRSLPVMRRSGPAGAVR